MQSSDQAAEYWRRTRGLMWFCLIVWALFGFVIHFWVKELNTITFMGFPLGFYMAAQGSLIVYVLIIWFYARYMNNLDHEYGVQEEEEE